MTEYEGHRVEEPVIRLDVVGNEVKAETMGLCGECKWWNISESYPADDMILQLGAMILESECRRHSIYCNRREDHWCGEFQPR